MPMFMYVLLMKNKLSKSCIIGNPNYVGLTCETLVCDIPDPELCLEFAIKDCLKMVIFYYCPTMCGYCPPKPSTFNTTIITTTSSTTTMTTTIKACLTKLACLNGAQQNKDTCECQCKLDKN